MTASSHVCINFPSTWPQPWHRNTCRAAYEQETRKIILSMDKVSKVSPQGKPILNGVGLGAFTHIWMTLMLQVTLPIRTWPTSVEALPENVHTTALQSFVVGARPTESLTICRDVSGCKDRNPRRQRCAETCMIPLSHA